MLLSCQSCSRWENAITLAVSLCPRAGGFSYRSVHNRRHIFNVLWCVPAYAPLSLPRACACCITAVDVARRYELHALAARQRRQLTPRLLVTGWTLLLLAQLAMLSACMHGRPRRRRCLLAANRSSCAPRRLPRPAPRRQARRARRSRLRPRPQRRRPPCPPPPPPPRGAPTPWLLTRGR